MRKTPEQKADESIALTATLLQTQSPAEAGLTLTCALTSMLMGMGLPQPEGLHAVGQLFADLYHNETEEDPCIQ
jgi:hypothetical protein